MGFSIVCFTIAWENPNKTQSWMNILIFQKPPMSSSRKRPRSVNVDVGMQLEEEQQEELKTQQSPTQPKIIYIRQGRPLIPEGWENYVPKEYITSWQTRATKNLPVSEPAQLKTEL